MSEIAEPPLNDVWTIPGEESKLAEFQATDRARFAAVKRHTHYHALQIQEFLQAVQQNRPPLVSGEDGRKVVAMFTAIYRSNRERRPIQFPIPPTRDPDLHFSRVRDVSAIGHRLAGLHDRADGGLCRPRLAPRMDAGRRYPIGSLLVDVTLLGLLICLFRTLDLGLRLWFAKC